MPGAVVAREDSRNGNAMLYAQRITAAGIVQRDSTTEIEGYQTSVDTSIAIASFLVPLGENALDSFLHPFNGHTINAVRMRGRTALPARS